jgi:hypothetical protein
VHRKYIQQDEMLHILFISGNCSTCFGWYFHPSSGRSAYNCIYSIWYFLHRYCSLPLSWKSWNRFECAVGGVRHPQHTQFPLRLDYGRSPYAYVNQRLQIQLELLMMSGVPLGTCWVFNERWNNKFEYKVASCWLFLLSHNTMHGSMNIKVNFTLCTDCQYHKNDVNYEDGIWGLVLPAVCMQQSVLY